MTLSRDQILAKRSDLPRTTVDVPEFGEVCIRSLTLKQVGEINALNKRNEEGHRINARVLIMACINEDGSPLFSPADQAAIEDLPCAAVTTVVNAVMKLSKLGDEADPKAPSGSGDSASD